MSSRFSLLLASLSLMSFSLPAFSAVAENNFARPAIENEGGETNAIEELDPFAPDIEEKLLEYDEIYEAETGMSPYLDIPFDLFAGSGGCYRESCAVYAFVSKAEQRLYLYVNGRLEDTWLVSTGVSGRSTPDFDRHPNGRIYEAYTSSSYPGGNYQGLGNMPYAVFIKGGFAIHGTPKSNWPKLGQRASHGCIRLHPNNGKRFNRLVRGAGIKNTWITVD